jgi:hypothetical protein
MGDLAKLVHTMHLQAWSSIITVKISLNSVFKIWRQTRDGVPSSKHARDVFWSRFALDLDTDTMIVIPFYFETCQVLLGRVVTQP